MAAKIYKINFKSDFVLTIQSDAGWAIPFCIKFWTVAPSKAYFVGYDGTNYHNCRMGETSDKLVVLFDDHHLPIGDLQMQIAYHTTIEDFPSVQFDEVTNPVIVKTEIDGQEYHVMLDFTGETAPEIEFSLPAYYNEQQRIANEQERERIFAEMQQAFATMQRESGAATAGAENVNATLNGTTLTVTDRTGHQTSSNVQGPPGPPGSGVQADWSETDPSADDYIKNKPTIPVVPTNVSDFTNDAGYITKSVNDLVNYYLKSETYTKQEVQALIAAIQQFHYEIYTSTSDVTSPQGNVLYLIGPTGTGSDKYEEYVYDATKQEPWVKIGDTSIDLSDYYTKGQTDSAITSALNTALSDYTTTAALTLLLAGKQDVINDLATIRSGAQAGATAYQKPQAGIPKTDLAQGVKDSLDLADTALQEDTLYVNVNNNGHEYVDLGLPSGTLWAKCNVGADDETGYGNYYMYGKGARQYNSSDSPYTGTEDPLDLSVDTAAQVWGGSWHMPTREQMQELIANTTYQWVTNYKGSGINGGTFTATNGAVLFIPAAGNWGSGGQSSVGNDGFYWGSSPSGSDNACLLYFNNGGEGVDNDYRGDGYSVRGVILPDTTQLKKDLDKKANDADLATVAKSGSYNDLTNKPTIPTALSQLSEDSTHRVVSDTEKTTWNNKQDALVSGTNIKTINNESILGSGNINIDISGKENVTTIVAPVNATDATLPITTLTCEAGKYYRIDIPVDTLAVTLSAMTDLTTVRTVVIYLTGGTTPAVTISSTAPTGGSAPDVLYQDGYAIEAGKTYEVNCLWNGHAWIVASVEIVVTNNGGE